MVCLPARMRTGLKRRHGLLEDRVIVLGRLEVDRDDRFGAAQPGTLDSIQADAAGTDDHDGTACA